MIGKAIGSAFAFARDAVARQLIRLHVTPNVLSLTGMVLTGCAGVCYAFGATSRFAWSLDPHGPNAYLLMAFGLLILSSACDMLDGAVARLGSLATSFGGFLDSTLDRYSDFAVYAGIAAAYAFQDPANVTFVLLSMLAFFNAFMISYSRARAETIIPRCSVGYWQRGERSAAILIATAAYNVPALVLQQAFLPLLTVLRRVFYTKSVIEGRSPMEDPRQGGWWLRVRLWRWPRKTLPYDLVTGVNILWLIFARVPAGDFFRITGS
ncbi:MAG: CDP-alcohol phosphatidyltransferase family protein [Planctomycetes bacterium]|jgi:phosphatidylglycerophosphate synthase|nr:CDP-alcohol phosphatidyltransferase family protein [Planctomycetota bacterium]